MICPLLVGRIKHFKPHYITITGRQTTKHQVGWIPLSHQFYTHFIPIICLINHSEPKYHGHTHKKYTHILYQVGHIYIYIFHISHYIPMISKCPFCLILSCEFTISVAYLAIFKSLPSCFPIISHSWCSSYWTFRVSQLTKSNWGPGCQYANNGQRLWRCILDPLWQQPHKKRR